MEYLLGVAQIVVAVRELAALGVRWTANPMETCALICDSRHAVYGMEYSHVSESALREFVNVQCAVPVCGALHGGDLLSCLPSGLFSGAMAGNPFVTAGNSAGAH